MAPNGHTTTTISVETARLLDDVARESQELRRLGKTSRNQVISFLASRYLEETIGGVPPA